MSVLFFYQTRDHSLRGSSMKSWRYASHVIPALIASVNQEATEAAALDKPGIPDFSRPLDPREIYRDEQGTDEVYFLDADELFRLFDWCTYLLEDSPVFGWFFKDLVTELRSWTTPIERYCSKS